jgi:hypothetical protein
MPRLHRIVERQCRGTDIANVEFGAATCTSEQDDAVAAVLTAPLIANSDGDFISREGELAYTRDPVDDQFPTLDVELGLSPATSTCIGDCTVEPFVTFHANGAVQCDGTTGSYSMDRTVLTVTGCAPFFDKPLAVTNRGFITLWSLDDAGRWDFVPRET